jgi:hypothetical protein
VLSKRLRAAAVLIWLGTVFNAQGQAPITQFFSLDQEVYDRVLDLIFPAPSQIRKPVIFTMSVRFIPAFDPESQILVTLVQGKPPSVIYAVADRNVFFSAKPVDKPVMSSDEAAITGIARNINVKSKVTGT